MTFANELLAKAGKSIGGIGLVLCAIGGTHLREWVKGTDSYTKLVERIKASEKQGGKVQGFFWYQEESDATVEEEFKCYERKLTKFFTDLRIDVNNPELPIILVCHLCVPTNKSIVSSFCIWMLIKFICKIYMRVKIVTHDFFISPTINFKEDVWKAQEAVTKKLPNVRMVDGLIVVGNFDDGLNEDRGHPNVKSEIILGKMFADHVFYSDLLSSLTKIHPCIWCFFLRRRK